MGKLIDADALLAKLHETYLPDGDARSVVYQVLVEQPEAVVRCKECLMHGVCRFEQGLGLDGFCSQAERRSDE